MSEVRNQLALTWGVETFLMPQVEPSDAMVRLVDEAVANIDGYAADDTVVIVAGSPPGTIASVGSTNLMRVHRLGTEDHI